MTRVQARSEASQHCPWAGHPPVVIIIDLGLAGLGWAGLAGGTVHAE